MKHADNTISWIHRLAAFLAAVAFCTIVLGALVASNRAATLLHAPDSMDKFDWLLLSGGAKYEPAYRVLAAASGLLAAGLAISLWQWGAKR